MFQLNLKKIITFLFLLTIISASKARVNPTFLKSDPACEQWVDSIFNKMTLKEKVGQLFVYKLAPVYSQKNLSLLKKVVKHYGVGGLLFSGGTVRGQALMTNQAQKWSDVPLMITFDGEWGLSMRLKSTPRFPRNKALGYINDNGLIHEYGREVAREFREMGVHVNFAPVADVNTNPNNPVIGSRSFGDDPRKVATKVIAYSSGLESGGILSVSKHFPGHGDTNTDSHKVLPFLPFTRERLDSIELYPFKEYINAGLGGVMVGHLEVPVLEPKKGLPASLSYNVVTKLLQQEMGFKGLVFTDALEMKGASANGSACVKAILAGHDMLLVPSYLKPEHEAILKAIKSGKIKVSEIERRCKKILTFKYYMGLKNYKKINLSGLDQRINTPYAKKLVKRLNEAAEKGKAASAKKKNLAQLSKGSLAHYIDKIALEGIHRGAYPGCQIVILKDGEKIYDKSFGYYTTKKKQKVQQASMYDIASLTKTSATLLAMMKLYDKGLYNLSDKISKYVPFLKHTNKRNITIRELLFHESGLQPSIIVYHELINLKSYKGHLFSSRKNWAHPIQLDTHFFAQKNWKFKDHLVSDRFSSEYPVHVSQNVWASSLVKDTLLHSVATSKLRSKRYRYSCVGFILLQQMVENLTKQPMNEFLAKEFYRPMNLEHTMYLPLHSFPKKQIVPSGLDPFLRKEVMQGYVHDETAAFLGGVSGNAGLFSTANDLAQLYQMFLNKGVYKGKRYLSAETCSLFTTTVSRISRRGLGFDRPNRKNRKHGPCSENTPLSTFGHTGFTGTCAWADPDNQVVYIFLSNRVYPKSYNKRLMSLSIRERIQKEIYHALK